MIRAWRISKAKYAVNAFDGEGARLYGSRWTSPGRRAVFVAESLSLAVLEILVHLHAFTTLKDYVVCPVDFAEDLVQAVKSGALPANWREYPAPPGVQAIGDAWIDAAAGVLLKVPSAITVTEFNYIINPTHPDFGKLTISRPQPFDVDPRVFGGKTSP
jgi:RES domain-containing protein